MCRQLIGVLHFTAKTQTVERVDKIQRFKHTGVTSYIVINNDDSGVMAITMRPAVEVPLRTD